MRKISLLFFLLIAFSNSYCRAQEFYSTVSLFQRDTQNHTTGRFTIDQKAGIDTLISRHILYNKKINGLDGFRIQIYRSNDRNAKMESRDRKIDFLNRFPGDKYPGLVPYESFAVPGYYIIRVGDFRTRTEGTKYLLEVQKVFPDSYLVPDIINFPE